MTDAVVARLGLVRLVAPDTVLALAPGIFARLSSDRGKTWSEEIVLRADGGGRDIGYPRSVQRLDGKVVTVYYFWDKATGPERYIAATIWSPAQGPAAKPERTSERRLP